MMDVMMDQLSLWMVGRENEHLEFKEAKSGYDTDTLTKYCSALANEGGGHVILGVSDKLPRRIVGSNALLNLEETKSKLIRRLQIRIDIDELLTENGRVLIFTVPSRPIGVPIQYNNVYWMRRGEELVAMTPDMLKRIFNEGDPDFTAQICSQATLSDLNVDAISIFRDLWVRKSGNGNVKNMTDEKLLNAIEVVGDKGITYAGLILFGTSQALGKYLAQAEVVFEYRSSHITGPAQQRIEYREGFFLFYNDLWEKINLRNDIQHFQDGLFIWDIPTFNEKAIRESILNAISHRDYRMPGSVWVKQYPRTITIASPGGFPVGINPENILWKQQPRNRRLAEVFAKCGLVERAGQGADTIFEESIKQGKPLPSFSRTDEHEVVITLDGQVQDENFLRFLEKIGQESLATFSTEDFLILDFVHKELPIPSSLSELKGRLKRLVDMGVVERVGQGRGAKYLLCRQFYKLSGQSGIYTRLRGLDKETNKELILRHIRENAKTGSKLADLCQVLPSLSKSQVQKLAKDLKDNGKINVKGNTKASLWFPIHAK
jgi:ATP-dependent DNA helicase RecG